MFNYYSNKNIIITGATSGLGKSLSKLLASYESNLLLISRTQSKLNELKSQINNNKSIIHTLAIDFTKIKAPQTVYQYTLNNFQGVDIIINNAGIGYNCFTTDVDINIAKEIFQINFFNIVELNKLLLPAMIKRNKGIIVNISSLGGKRSLPTNSMYCASKFALEGYLESLRCELKYSKIKVINIRPSFINNTNFYNGKYIDKELGSNFENNLKTINKMSADDTAKIIVKSVFKNNRVKNISLMCNIIILINSVFPSFVDKLVIKLRKKHILSNLNKYMNSFIYFIPALY